MDGRASIYYPGDWVEIGKQTAIRWIEAREARAAAPILLDMPPGCGVVLLSEDETARGQLAKARDLSVTVGLASLVYERTLILDPRVPLRIDLLAAGFGFLERFEVAAAMADYDHLAESIGTSADRERTMAIVRDLRVPCYHPGLLFLRRCEGAQHLLDAWREEEGGDERLALLRAVYRVKPLLLTLPPLWIGGKE